MSDAICETCGIRGSVPGKLPSCENPICPQTSLLRGIVQLISAAPEPSVAAEAAHDGVVLICPDCETPFKTCGCERKILDDYKAGKITNLRAIELLADRIGGAVSAHPGIVPGWVMVPVEPTEAMIEAGYSAAVSAGQMRYSTLKFIWERLLAAAIKGQP